MKAVYLPEMRARRPGNESDGAGVRAFGYTVPCLASEASVLSGRSATHCVKSLA